MTILKDRDYLVRIAGLEFTGLDIAFDIKKSLDPEPNSCSLTIYNLSKEHQQQIEQLNLYDPKKKPTSGRTAAGRPGAVAGTAPAAARAAEKPPKPTKAATNVPVKGRIPVEILAGYKSTGIHVLFAGDLRRAITTNDGTTAETKIEGEDGGRSYLMARVSRSFPKGTIRAQVVKACADAMGLGLGNIDTVIDQLQTPYTAGTVIHGAAVDELRLVLRRAGITYSIQNGVLQYRTVGQGRITNAFEISAATGMVGSPERDATGMVSVTCLLLPTIAPGAYVSLVSNNYQGVYRIHRVNYSGASDGNAWYAKLELTPG